MSDAGSPLSPSGTPRSHNGIEGGSAPSLPTAMALLSSVKRAFDASRDAPASAARVLKSSTSCKGFQGKHRTKKWCCRLTAVLDVLVDRDIVPDGALVPLDTHSALFLILGVEMTWWERLRTRGAPASAQAHLQHLAVDAGLRLGVLLGQLDEASMPQLLDPNSAWADPSRRGEFVKMLMETSGFRTQKEFCKVTGFNEDTVTGWVRHGRRPTPESIDLLSAATARRIPGASRSSLARLLWWHYALSSLSSEIAAAFGQEFAGGLARLFIATTTQVAANARAGLASGAIRDNIHVGEVGSLRTWTDVSPPVTLLQHVGASDEIIAQVKIAQAAWKSVMVPAAGKWRADLLVLITDMPKRAKGERGRRRRRPKTQPA